MNNYGTTNVKGINYGCGWGLQLNFPLTRFFSTSTTPQNIRAYFIATFLQNSSAMAITNPQKIKIKHKIAEYANLKDNWNGNGACTIPTDTVLKAFELLDLLPVVPDVFPTANGTLQFEYEKETGEYLEIELQGKNIKVFSIDSKDEETNLSIEFDEYEIIQKMARSFYE